MNRLRKPLKEWFGYNHRERRAALVLLVFCILIVSVRFVVAGSDEEPVISQIVTEPEPSTQISAGSQDRVLVNEQRRVTYVELNSCDSAALDMLPGIGTVLSARIIKYRNLLGGFADKRQLLEVYGLPTETFDKISQRVTTDTTLLVKIKINSSDYRELVRHPYLSPAEVSTILKYRATIGRIEGWKTVTENNLITSDKAGLLRFYLSYE
jgi:DNA uptake protein ComE-like DNA-binding protein